MKLNTTYHTIRLILGDQLNAKHSWLRDSDDGVLYVIAELKQEATYVRHHIQKLCAFFLAMENFSEALISAKYHVLHYRLDESSAFNSLNSLIADVVERFDAENFQFQRPDEFRLLHQLRDLELDHSVEITEFDTEHFLVPFDEIDDYIKPQQHNRMESFYRKMRKRYDILMDNGQPVGEQWNYDSENREKLKPKDLLNIPQPLLFDNDISEIMERIEKHNIPYFGKLGPENGEEGQEEKRKPLLWPVSRTQASQLLTHFCRHCLPFFGRFQDAMTGGHPDQWTLYHSRLSFAINSKILHPRQVIDAALTAFEQSEGEITLPQIEGFVRQILGWREYVRGVYWVNMPEYSHQNALNATRDLPGYFWSGKTKMACMHHAIDQSLTYAYAHHIQRLMITGNFCLLTGVDPDQVDAWYLGVYIDAIEWVEMPNTRGMSQFADGGWVATKPYVAGGNYVNKMSDYCKGCHYNVKEKTTDNACPLNSLYWGFMNTHRDWLAKNPRIGMVYRSWDKQSEEVKTETLVRAKWCLENIERL